MGKKRNGDDERPRGSQPEALSRRDFFNNGAAMGVTATALATVGSPIAAQELAASGTPDTQWDYEADVVVLGAGAAGLPAAIRSRDFGASVIVVDQNFDIGGRMFHSGGEVSLGGGDAVQERDLAGETDAFVTVGPMEPPEALRDDPDLLFKDMTDWSIVNTGGRGRYKFNNREVLRAWSDNTVPTRQFLMDNYVRFTRVTGTHFGGGLSRARRAISILQLGDVTDMRAGTVTQDDAGRAGQHSSRFAVRVMSDQSSRSSPGVVGRGTAISRALEFSAKEKGVQFLLNRHMDDIIREDGPGGRVVGIRASFTPRHDPETGEMLVSYGEYVGGEWAKGLIDEPRPSITIRARKAVIICTGAHHGNPHFRSMFHPAGLEPSHTTSGWSLLGGDGRANDASGIIAAMRVGANLDGMQQTYHNSLALGVRSMLGVVDAGFDMLPGHPTFSLRGAIGINAGGGGFEHLIVVNQVGKRIFNEMKITSSTPTMTYPQQGATKRWDQYVHGDWRNCRPELLRETFDDNFAIDAVLAMNEGSQPPHFLPGPTWAIFDHAAVERARWNVEPPYTTSNGLFFKADTIEELAAAMYAHGAHQNVPVTHLEDTVARWNAAVASGVDEDFERDQSAPMHAIGRAPFYAAAVNVEWQDSCGGLRINGKSQVLDMRGEVIPGLYAGGESAGGHEMHGIGKGSVQGYIAGTNAAAEA